MKPLLGLSLLFGQLLAARQAQAQWEPYQPHDRYEPPAWHKQQHVTPQLRTWAVGSGGGLTGGTAYWGGSMAVGYESQFSIHPTINETFFGSAFAAELRGHGFKQTPLGSSGWLILVGGAFSSHILSQSHKTLPRWRMASIFSTLVPEVGAAFRDGHGPSPYTRWSLPVGWLLSPAFALELVPSVSMLYSNPSGNPELLWQIGLGASWRQLGPLPRLL